MVKKIILIVPLIAILILNACNFKPPKKLSTMEKIQIRLTELKQYIATAKITKISNKGENEYSVKQYYKMSGEYRVEYNAPKNIAGNVIVNNGETLVQLDPSIGGKILLINVSDEYTQVFLGKFIENYFQSEESTVSVTDMDKSGVTVLETVIPGENEYMATEKLWIDNESLNPIKLVLYDKSGNERTIVTYSEFNYNVEIDDSVFILN